MYQPDDVSGIHSLVVLVVNMFLSFFYMVIRSESGKHCGSHRDTVCKEFSVYMCDIFGQMRVEQTVFKIITN